MYYAEYDEHYNLYCVFHVDTGKCVASYYSLEEAEHKADELNE